MRKTLLTAVALSAMASTAMAADLPRRAPAMAPAPVYAAPIFTWTGFYVGGQLGYQWGNVNLSPLSYNSNGVVGGLHAGYNMQFGSIVAGVEGDIEASSFKGSVGLPGLFVKSRLPWQGSLRGRVGVAFDRALIYATGGVAFANIRHEIFAPPFAVSSSSTRAGWTVGAGVEYAISNNWSVRGEYRYTDFGRHAVGFPPFGAVSTRVNDHAVRVGVSYRFGGPAGAVLARY